MKKLIVNADDFGLTRGVNEGIIRAHRDGILTSTTLMATGPAFEDAVAWALANPMLGVGCHLVLVGGRAVSPALEIPSLADQSGNLPQSLAVFVSKISAGKISPVDIGRELRAQIAKIRAAGIEPTHLDTHKHTHAHPVVMKVLAQTARSLGITKIRKPMESLRDSWETSRKSGGVSAQLLASAAVRAVTPKFYSIAKQYDLLSPEHFLGLAMTGKLGPAALRRLIEMLPEGQTEIMVHPGICDQDLQRTGSRLQEQRQRELDGLLDPAVRSAISVQGIRLISYRELN